MNEFEWRRQMRELRETLAPPDQVWFSIERTLDSGYGALHGVDESAAQPGRTARARWWPGAAAASLVLLACVGWYVMTTTLMAPSTVEIATSSTWKPADPRLVGAAIELSAAQAELKLALEQAPGSPALQRLLDRTETQQTRLRQRSHQAG